MKENYHLVSDLDNMDLPPMAAHKDNRTFPLANEPRNHGSELKLANEQPASKPTKDCSSAVPTQCSQKASGNQSVIGTLTP